MKDVNKWVRNNKNQISIVFENKTQKENGCANQFFNHIKSQDISLKLINHNSICTNK